MELRDYNGSGRWSREGIANRYRELCRELGVASDADLNPREHVEGAIRWIYPVMENVIRAIEEGDRACISLGIEFIEEDQQFPFGKVLKSNTARALRRAPLTEPQIARIRKRVVAMLLDGNVPHEFKQYAKLLRRIGVRESWAEIEQKISRANPYVMRWYDYLREGPGGST